MSDEEFLAALESCSLNECDFGHAAHVRAAYLYSRSRDFAAALEKMRRAIRTYAASLGKADRYHETIAPARDRYRNSAMRTVRVRAAQRR